MMFLTGDGSAEARIGLWFALFNQNLQIESDAPSRARLDWARGAM